MDEETQKTIDEQIKLLPKEVIEAIISVDYKVKLREITKRQKLLIDQAGKLEMETTLVMIGLEPLADYVNNLQRELEITPARAKEIALDVSENIFKEIRIFLEKMDEDMLSENPEAENSEINSETEKEEGGGVEIETKINTNEIGKEEKNPNLNRNQILSEIENPNTIQDGNRSMNFKKEIIPVTTELEIRPEQTLETIPGEEVKDVEKPTIKKETVDIFKAKMTGTIITPQKVTEEKTETKLPEVEKKRPSSGVDPYREPFV
jgi:hypothetical protein